MYSVRGDDDAWFVRFVRVCVFVRLLRWPCCPACAAGGMDGWRNDGHSTEPNGTVDDDDVFDVVVVVRMCMCSSYPQVLCTMAFSLMKYVHRC